MTLELPLMQVTRAALRYHGGKWKIAPWIISHFPEHRVYVEPFGGAASVLLRKPLSRVEIYNDLDDDVVNLFRILRDPAQAEELRRLCGLTPFARTEFDLAREDSDTAMEAARKLVFRSHAGFGSHSHNAANSNGFRSSATEGKNYAREWSGIPAAIDAITQRFRHVIIERRNAFEVVDRYNQADALLYVDPPYVMRTRDDNTKGYVHELTNAEHLVCRTGSSENNVKIASAAQRRNCEWKPYEAGFVENFVSRPAEFHIMKSEEMVFEFVRLPYLPPEAR